MVVWEGPFWEVSRLTEQRIEREERERERGYGQLSFEEFVIAFNIFRGKFAEKAWRNRSAFASRRHPTALEGNNNALIYVALFFFLSLIHI